VQWQPQVGSKWAAVATDTREATNLTNSTNQTTHKPELTAKCEANIALLLRLILGRVLGSLK